MQGCKTYKINRLHPVVLIHGHVELGHDVTRLADMQYFCARGVLIVDIFDKILESKKERS